MLELIPISKTEIDWNIFLRTLKEVLGENPTKTIDQQKIKLGSLAYAEILKKFFKNQNAHIHYGFMIISKEKIFFELFQYRMALSITKTISPDYSVGILSGTLNEFKELIIECSTGTETQELRTLANKLQGFFETEGLYLFDAYSKRPNNDSTHKLIEHKTNRL